MSQDSNLPVNTIPLIFDDVSEPDFSSETPLHIDVDTESAPGENQGQTTAVPGLNPNVLVSLDPNFNNINYDAGEVFSYVELPVVSFSVDKTTIVEGGEAQILTFNLSEPAPSGGLVVNIRVDDPDGDSGPGDTTFPPEFISNITDFGQVEEDGIITASLTIAEGSSEATFGVVAFEDDLVEVGETYSFTLLEDESYIVATGSTTITTTIEDAIKPAFIQQDLYFGLNIPNSGEVSQQEFQEFLDNVVAPKFIGLTQFDAQGIVRDDNSILKEPSKVVTLLLEDTPENKAAVNEVLSEYQQQFSGAGVLQVANKDDFKVSFAPGDDLIDNDATPELIQADLYFGRNFADGEISSSEFQAFVDNTIAPRFFGLTQFDARGQVRDDDGSILKESTKVVTLLLEDTQANETAINQVLELYQQQFPGAGVAQTVNEDVAIAFGVANDIIDNDGTPETIQADLYFGRNIPNGGEVSEAGFQAFIDNVVAPRFAGLTQFDAQGQVSNDDGSILKEPSKVVTLILEDTQANESAIQDVLTAYQQLFNGAGVAQVIDEEIKVNFEPLTVVSFSADRTVVSEDGEAQLITFNLSEPAPAGGLAIKLRIDDPDGEPGDTEDVLELFSNIIDSGNQVEDGIFVANITIAEGATEATIGIKALTDNKVEGDETYSLTLLENENYIVDSASTTITTTIEDSDFMKPTVSITPETLTSTEGNTFAWKFTLDKPVPSGGLTLNLPITQNNDPAPGDVNYFVEGSTGITDFSFLVGDDVSLGFTVTLAEGVTEAILVSEAVADGVAESDEIFTTVLADGEDYTANPESNQVTTVISDETIVSFTPSQVDVAEGNTFAWNFSLNKPAPEGGLTLNLPITQNNDPAPGDVEYNVEGSSNISDFGFLTQDEVSLGFSITIAEGETSAKLVSKAIADDIEEGDEIFTTVLADGDNYRANPLNSEVVTTIVDTSTDLPTLSLNAEPTNVNEGEQLKFNFELTEAAPMGGLTVNLDLVEDTDPLPGDITYFVEGSENITDFELLVNDDTGLIDGATVKIAEGATSATLLNDIIADNNTEGPESVKFGLANGDYSIDSDDNAASFTIIDTSTNLPTLSLNAEPTNVNEGEQLKFNFDLTEAAPMGGLTVNLDLVEDTDPLPGDITYFVDGSENITDFELLVNDDTGLIDGATVKIAEGATSATLLNDIIADNNTEGPESVKFGLADGSYSIDSDDNAASFTIVDTSVANEISGTIKDDDLYGTKASEIISGGRGDDNISGNGGGDTLIGGRGDDDIYGSFEADEISGGRGDDFIFGNGGNDLIDSGLGFDTVFLGAGEATVILDKGEGFDTIFNFQLGASKLEVSSLDNLNFADGDSGAEIFLEGDKLAVVAGQSANTFNSNQDMIFAV